MPIWSTYVATDDADLVATRVEAAGGQVVVAPFDVFDQGRMAVFADPAGAAFSVWQPMAMPGAELFNVPGAMCWNELVTPDPEGAKEFYALVFGWQPEEQPVGPVTYTGWRLRRPDRRRDDAAAGRRAARPTCRRTGRSTSRSTTPTPPPPAPPSSAAPSWSRPATSRPGRSAVLRDPQGALFSDHRPAA